MRQRLIALCATLALAGCFETPGSVWREARLQDQAALDAVASSVLKAEGWLTEAARSRGGPPAPDVSEYALRRCGNQQAIRYDDVVASEMERIGALAGLQMTYVLAQETDDAMQRCLRALAYPATLYWQVGSSRMSTAERHDYLFRTLVMIASAGTSQPALRLGGCGSRGGPGYRRPDGRCASWND